MTKLPNPKDFKSFKADLSKRVEFDDNESNYDLEKIYNSLQSNSIPKGYISNLFDVNILKHNPNTQQILKKYLTYSKIDDSLAITLQENEEIKTIAINRSKNQEGNLIKWKTLGSKKHIEYKIKDDFVFIVYGMAEIVLCELLDISYIAFQSDSIALNLQNHKQWQEDIKAKLKDKVIILLLDNDDSCRKTINPLKEELSNENKLIPIDMEQMEFMQKALLYGGTLLNPFPKGFDFRDFCNSVADVKKIEEIITETIKAEI